MRFHPIFIAPILIVAAGYANQLEAGDHPAVGALAAPVTKSLAHQDSAGNPGFYAVSSTVPEEFRGPKGGDSRKWIMPNSPQVNVVLNEIQTGGAKPSPFGKILVLR